MNPFEKEYKNRFKDATSTDGIDPDMIWNSISDALPEENIIPPAKKRFIKRKRYLLLLLLLLFLTGTIAFYFVGKKDPIVAQSKNEIANAETVFKKGDKNGSEVLEKEMTKANEIDGEPVHSSGAEAMNSIQKQEAQGEAVASNKKSLDGLKVEETGRLGFDNKKISKANDEVADNNGNAQKEITAEVDDVKELENMARSNFNNKTTTKIKKQHKESEDSITDGLNPEIDKITIQRNRKTEMEDHSLVETKDLSSIKTDDLFQQTTVVDSSENSSIGIATDGLAQAEKSREKTNESTPLMPENSNITIPTKTEESRLSLPTAYDELPFLALNDFKINREPVIPVSKNKNLSIGVFAGLIGWSDLYKGNNQLNLKDQINKATSADLGQSISLVLEWQFSKRLHLSTGLEFLNTQTVFNYVSQSNTVAVLDDYPDLGLIDVLAIRTVKHHNKQSIFSIPIAIGTSKKFRDFDLGINAGIGLNYIVNQKGKSLNEENIITEYDSENNDPLPYQQYFLSYQLQPHLTYSIRKQFKIQLRSNIRYMQHGDSAFYGLKVSSLAWGINVGGLVGF